MVGIYPQKVHFTMDNSYIPTVIAIWVSLVLFKPWMNSTHFHCKYCTVPYIFLELSAVEQVFDICLLFVAHRVGLSSASLFRKV